MEKETMELISKLAEIKTKYNMLVDYLINSADLNYNGSKLRFSDCEDVIYALEKEKYEEKLEVLRCKEIVKKSTQENQ